MEGVQQDTSNAHDWQKNLKITVTSNKLEKLREIVKLMPKEVKLAFKKAYGHIMDLLLISVEASALSALAQFWNHSLCCFELPNLDATPTIEEYIIMTRLPIRETSGVYLYKGCHVGEEKIATLIGVQVNQMRMEGRGSTRGIRKDFLEAHLQALAQQGRWDLFNRTLALTIYGLVLFPFSPNIVDTAAMDVFFGYDQHRMNPIPAILADTFLSLGVCHRNNGGRLRCCAELLYAWFMTHVYADYRMGRCPDPLIDFHRIQTPHQEAQGWKLEFARIQSSSFKWVCPWYNGKDTILSCGDFPNVPLMGPRGCISYSPTLVLRQLHWTQRVPQEEQLKTFSFLYSSDRSTIEQEKKIRMAWQSIKVLGKKELGEQRVTASHEYQEWRKVRVGPSNLSKGVTDKPVPSSTQEVIQLTSQVEVLKAQTQFLTEKKQEAHVKIEILQSRCQKMAKEIEVLKDECADATQLAMSRKGKDKVSATHVAKIRELEEMLSDLRKEKNKLESEVNKKGQKLKRAEGEISKRDERISSLKEEVQQEREVARQFQEEIEKEKHARNLLEQQVSHLSAVLRRTEHDCAQAWLTASEYQEQFVNAEEKHKKLTGEMGHYIPNLIYRFEKANEQIKQIPPFELPREITQFMKSCEGITKGLKRKKTKFLM